jgi:hypothetical protein
LNISQKSTVFMTRDLEAVLSNKDKTNDEKKTALRNWIFDRIDEEHDGGWTIAEGLSRIFSDSHHLKETAVVLIRLLSIGTVLPQASAQNKLERIVVEICEAGVPDLCKFLKIEKKQQTYQKFQIFENAHISICELLSPLIVEYGDLEALCSARKEILGRLNHSFVREYCGPFGLQELKAEVEVSLNKISHMAERRNSFLQDYEGSKAAIEAALRVSEEHRSFISREYFLPLFETSERTMADFLNEVRQQYSSDVESAWGDGEYLNKGYPLHEVGREFSLTIPLRIDGNGFAENFQIALILDTSDLSISNSIVNMGNVAPGQFSVTFDTKVILPSTGFSGIFEVQWGELGNPEIKKKEFTFSVRAQSTEVDWPRLEFASPYGADVAEGDKFIGRAELVRRLASKVLRTPMEPFYITGQKRVGKTSLALAAIDSAKANGVEVDLCSHYILWGDVAHAAPLKTLEQFGKNVETFLRACIPDLVDVERSDFEGSLAPLGALAELALRMDPKKRFVIIVDEFDEIPQEMYLKGNLAETFFANLRSLSRKKNICLVFVGGENMPYVMDRQGQKLNNFARVNLSYFSRDTEWSDFQQLVRIPSKDILLWHDDAIGEVYNSSNGNPYFAKLICATVFSNAVSERDTDVTAQEVLRATDNVVSTLGANSFAHLWQDGIPRPTDEREPDIMRRSRAMIATARVLNEKSAFARDDILKKRDTLVISEAELSAVLNDFVQRNVIEDNFGEFSFVLPIFSKWLVESGAQQIISDTLSEELAQSTIASEIASRISSKDISELVTDWPTYRGKEVNSDQVRSWLDQVDDIIDRAILFQLLKRVVFVREEHIREMLRVAFGIIRRDLPVPVQTARNQLRNDVVVTYVDGEGKSGSSYTSLFTDENRISASRIVSKSSFKQDFVKFDRAEISSVVIIDDLAASGKSLSDNVSKFIKENRETLAGVKVRVVALLATSEATRKIQRDFEKIEDVDLKLNVCETLKDEDRALPKDHSGFKTEEDWVRAHALLTDLGARIDRRSPLGFGGMGLLVVFPGNTPNNTLPILRSKSKQSAKSKMWIPLFERVSHL